MNRLVDPRIYQIVVLAGLLGYGWAWLGFDIAPARAALLVVACLVTQAGWTSIRGLPAFDPRSALISALSLCLLLRTDDALRRRRRPPSSAIASKFVVRVRGKHVFNPTNVGLVVMLLVTTAAWLSPGQWGSVAFFAFLMACLGGLVADSRRARRRRAGLHRRLRGADVRPLATAWASR